MRITINSEAYDRIMHWVQKADFEVSGFGKCTYDQATKTVNVLSAYLPLQEGSAAMTDLDAQALAKLMYDKREEPGEMRFWWHSHVNMSAFWSGTDTATIKELGAHGWCAAVVFNKRCEYRAAVCYETEIKVQSETRNGFGEQEAKNEAKKDVDLQDNLQMTILYPDMGEEARKAWDAEFDANVKRTSVSSKWPWPTRQEEIQGGKEGSSRSSYEGYGSDEDGYWTKNENGHWHKRYYEDYNRTLLTDGYKAPKAGRDARFFDSAWGARDEGVAAEAASLGINYYKYLDILEGGDPAVLADLDRQLIEIAEKEAKEAANGNAANK